VLILTVKQFIRNFLFGIMGERRARGYIRRLRGQKPSFSEAELILEYFETHPRLGTMIDVGAHFGESLAPYLRMGWKILAFEPDPANRAKLQQNVDASRIRLFDSAVSDHAEEGVAFFASPESDGISGLSAFRDSHREVNRVRLVTLDAVLEKEAVENVDFLKIDTEGHDLLALKGFPWTRITPEVILCEFEDSKTVPLGYTYRDMGDYLLAQGYTVFLSEWAPIVRYGITHQWKSWRAYPCALASPKAWGNLVAFKRGVVLQSLSAYSKRIGGDWQF